MKTPSNPPPSVAAKRNTSIWVGKKLYDGKELQPYTNRPGAMDAFALPSKGNKT